MALNMIRKRKVETVDGIAAEIENLNAQGGALCAEIDVLAAREDALIDEHELAAAIVATRAARNRLRAIDAQLADAQDRMNAAQSLARGVLLAQLRGDYMAAAKDFSDKAFPAMKAAERLLAARDAVQTAGFRTEYDSLPVPPVLGGGVVLAPDLLDIFANALKGPVAPSAPPPQTFRKPVAIERMGGPVRLYDEPPRTEHAPPRPPLRETAGDGEQLVYVVRNGLEHFRTGEQLRTGDVVAVPLQIGTALANNGAASPMTPEEVATLDAGNSPITPEAAPTPDAVAAPVTAEKETA